MYNHNTVTHKINFARLAQLIKTKVSETIPIQGSNNLVTSGGIYNAIKASADSKADKATTLEGYGITNAYNMVESDIRFVPKYSINSSGWDNTPTENSTNPVISGGVYTSVSNVQSQLQTTETTPTEFYFDYQGGKYGWNSSSARGADTFHPFKQPATQTKVITAKTTTDLGEDNEYRYIDTTGVVNTNSGTYKPTTRNVSIDMGASNSYRYVNTSEVPNTNSGTYTASSRGASLDMGATNSYRYVNTNGVPNSNSGTYTFPAGDNGDTKDLGVTNSYRYVNARNVYFQGVNDGRGTLFFENYNFEIAATSHESDFVTSTTSVNVGQNGRTVKGAYLASIYCRSQSRYIANLYNATVSLSGNTATVSVTIQGAQVSADGTHIFGGQVGVVYI